MATLDNDDLKAIKGLMEVTIDEAIETKLVTKEDISHLPNKDVGEGLNTAIVQGFFCKLDHMFPCEVG